MIGVEEGKIAMTKILGLPRLRHLFALVVGALIVPVTLLATGDIGAATACIYWSVSVAAVIAGSVCWAYLQLAADSLVDRFG